MSLPRSSGILMHVTSLPGGHGTGDFGPGAFEFIDWLAAAGQRLWQVLPLGPPGYGGSPYASSSAFAGSPWLISLDALCDRGLLEPDELKDGPLDGPVDLAAVQAFKGQALHLAFSRFQPDDVYREFCSRASYWLDDYGRTIEHFGGNEAFERFVQFEFDRQWQAVRRYANERGIHIMGDIPIFVADSSVDVLAHPELFALDLRGKPSLVAGVPPDLFSETGQRWGNPLYRWDVMAKDGYAWWRDRMRRMLELVDVVRIDHFRGFAAYWEVAASERTAVKGRWRPGPGIDLFNALRQQLGELPIVVEDLGLITPDVIALREQLGYPGMKVLQFAFSGQPENSYLPHNYSPDCVVYTGTHDNQTTRGWYTAQPPEVQHQVRSYLDRDGSEIAWDFIRLAEASVARMAIVPVQDALSLGDEARLNFPGKSAGNWSWRLSRGALTDDLAYRLHELVVSYGRLSDGESPAEEFPDEYPLT